MIYITFWTPPPSGTQTHLLLGFYTENAQPSNRDTISPATGLECYDMQQLITRKMLNNSEPLKLNNRF